MRSKQYNNYMPLRQVRRLDLASALAYFWAMPKWKGRKPKGFDLAEMVRMASPLCPPVGTKETNEVSKKEIPNDKQAI